MLFAMIHELLAPYQDGARVMISGEDIEVGDAAATPLALLYHELATNAAKYGAFSQSSGKVTITVSRVADNVRMTWLEEHGPAVNEPAGYGFGTRLSLISVEEQLGGSILYDWKPSGLSVITTVPASSVVRPRVQETCQSATNNI